MGQRNALAEGLEICSPDRKKASRRCTRKRDTEQTLTPTTGMRLTVKLPTSTKALHDPWTRSLFETPQTLQFIGFHRTVTTRPATR